MAERSPSERLDDAVEAMMKNPDEAAPRLAPRLDALLRVAAELRDLPRQAFKARLAAALAVGPAAPPPSYGKALVTEDDILARVAELAAEPGMVAYDLDVALRDLPDRAMRFLASLNECTIGVSRFWGEPHWERHPGGDELLHVLDGEAEVETLTDAGPVHSTVRAGSIFICPQGLWHRVLPRSPVALLFATPGEGTESSSAADPRGKRSARRSAPAAGRRGKAASPVLEARDIRSVLAALPELRIGSETTAEQADGAFGEIATLNRCTMYVGRFQGDAPWERHSNGDELLHILDGEAELTVLTDDGPLRRTLRAGSLFVCPRGLWHRQVAPRGVTAIYATPKPTDVSFADDPRLDA